MELPFPVVQRTYLASFEPARDAVEVESVLEEKIQITLFQNALTQLDVQSTTESITVRKEQQASADKGGEDGSSSSLGEPRNRSAFSERNERSDMAAGSPFHSTRSGKQLTSDEGESAEFSSC